MLKELISKIIVDKEVEKRKVLTVKGENRELKKTFAVKREETITEKREENESSSLSKYFYGISGLRYGSGNSNGCNRKSRRQSYYCYR